MIGYERYIDQEGGETVWDVPCLAEKTRVFLHFDSESEIAVVNGLANSTTLRWRSYDALGKNTRVTKLKEMIVHASESISSLFRTRHNMPMQLPWLFKSRDPF